MTILRWTAAQDVGRAIHPSYVEGQIQGGAVQGIGWALNEEYIYDDRGRLENPGFLDYRMPVASDLPMIEAVLVEVPNPAHPYGVKGVGEVNICPPMARHCECHRGCRRGADDGVAHVASPAARDDRRERSPGGVVARPPRTLAGTAPAPSRSAAKRDPGQDENQSCRTSGRG